MSAIAQPKTKPLFVSGLRAGRGTIDLSRASEPRITVRVEMPDLWETVRIAASPNEPVVSIKRAALEAFVPEVEAPEEFVLKLRGWEILDEGESLADAGAIDGSIFLITYRRKRAVR